MDKEALNVIAIIFSGVVAFAFLLTTITGCEMMNRTNKVYKYSECVSHPKSDQKFCETLTK